MLQILENIMRIFIYMFLFCSIFFILFTPSSLKSETGSVVPGKIIVKFKKDSPLAKKWLDSDRKGAFPEFEKILGSHSSRAYISDNLITALQKKQMRNSILSSVNKAGSLSRICVIEFSQNISPILAAKKLEMLNDIEYAEPIYHRYLCWIPNDTDIGYQYYLKNIMAFDAWDEIDSDSTVIIGIVDTGVFYEHSDLANNIYVNSGESGLDDEGNDKSSNGIDDDDNGFVDDWRGWDFVSSNTIGYDNDPRPGNPHGTHVSGIAAGVANNNNGIAGTAPMAKILPVKIGADHPWTTSVERGFEGILYAAISGAGVINCSWGGSDKSRAEQEVIDQCVALGSVVVAAAGNNNKKGRFYPASYDGVMSVAAVGEDDVRAPFSNYDTRIDVSAPGRKIYSTIPPYNRYSYDTTYAEDSTIVKIDTITTIVAYDSWDGTSMASPVAAGVVALTKKKFPDYTPLQIIEQVKQGCDNIDSLNKFYVGNLGRGRVNALKALTNTNARACIIKNVRVYDENSDGDYDNNEEIQIEMDFLNVLAPLHNASITVSCIDPVLSNRPQFANNTSILGNMITNQQVSAPDKIIFTVPELLPYNCVLDFEVAIADADGEVNKEYFTLTFAPSYRTMRSNNISITVNSSGNFAFNDYSSNNQGEGFSYKKGENLLFEGAFMAGISSSKVSNVARADEQSKQDKSFKFNNILELMKPGKIAAEEANANFFSISEENNIPLEVKQTVYQFDEPDREDFIITVYDIVNTGTIKYDSLFTGLFFDWDIGPEVTDNICEWQYSDAFGVVRNTARDTVPMVGVKLLSSQDKNFFAMNNNSTEEGNPGCYDGFTLAEKWLTMSSGILRDRSDTTDVSMIISAGPIDLLPGDTARVCFSIFAGNSLDKLKTTAEKSYQTALDLDLNDELSKIPRKVKLYLNLSPNPSKSGIKVKFGFHQRNTVSFSIYDYLGRKIEDLLNNRTYSPGVYDLMINIDLLSQGFYLLRMETANGSLTKPFAVMR